MAAAWRNPNFRGKDLSLEDAAAQCHDFLDFIASNFSERYRNGHNKKYILEIGPLFFSLMYAILSILPYLVLRKEKGM